MKKLAIGLVQQSAWDLPVDSMPLAAGYLKAILDSDADLATEVDVTIHNLRGGWSLSHMAKTIFADGTPDILAFSVLGWNYRNFSCLADLYKQLNPNGLVVFGGNHVSHQADKVFHECPAPDVVVNGEGEITFRELVAATLRNPGEPDFSDVLGVSYRLPGGSHRTTGDRDRLDSLDVLPSPFLSGAIPMQDHTGTFPYEFALMETNRGCPYKCSFCYWGGAVGQRVRSFSRERLAEELDFLAFHKASTIFLCDANFGMLEADEEFVEDLLDCHAKHGFPSSLEANWAKNKSERFHRIVKLLRDHGFKSSFTLALQTLTDEALTIMGRRNMKLNQWEDLADWLAAEDMECFVELIWGAPGETPDTFLTGYDKIAERVPRIAVYPLLLLPNTSYTENREVHGFVTLKGQSDDFDYVLANRTSTLPENLAMQRFMYLARLLGENQYFKTLWRPARILAGVSQSALIKSLLEWIEAGEHPSVVAFRDSIPVIAESPAVARGHRLLYSDRELDSEIERWWVETVVPRFPEPWRAFGAQLYRFARWMRPVYQPPEVSAPPAGLRIERDDYVSEPVPFDWPVATLIDELKDDVSPAPRPAPVAYVFRGKRGFYQHLDNHEVGAHYFMRPEAVPPA
ncbi:KedN5 family methylcobalamin-dependent radical SAM C-methyltransferase [Streptomyces sp. 8N706]|uniref:KedN5 family methylcobalamin-dependent radical SAM C-methyltransferase n=1 Tax=Streptomyces sp. 8N706 TaxID=3457416 RepID=UPI003FD5D5CD